MRAQYKEAFAVVRCTFEGRTYSRCVYIWVDKDFAMLRGIHQGYPKKFGSIHMTRPHPFAPAPQVAVGGMFGATLAANDRRLAEAVITLDRAGREERFRQRPSDGASPLAAGDRRQGRCPCRAH